MLLRCKKCGEISGEPSIPVGIFLIAGATIVTGIVLSPIVEFVRITGWIVAPIVFIASFFGVGLLDPLFFYAKYGFRRCDSCGNRNWSWPYYRGGFGL